MWSYLYWKQQILTEGERRDRENLSIGVATLDGGWGFQFDAGSWAAAGPVVRPEWWHKHCLVVALTIDTKFCKLTGLYVQFLSIVEAAEVTVQCILVFIPQVYTGSVSQEASAQSCPPSQAAGDSWKACRDAVMMAGRVGMCQGLALLTLYCCCPLLSSGLLSPLSPAYPGFFC